MPIKDTRRVRNIELTEAQVAQNKALRFSADTCMSMKKAFEAKPKMSWTGTEVSAAFEALAVALIGKITIPV